MNRRAVVVACVMGAALAAPGCGVRPLDPGPAAGSGAASGSGSTGAGDDAAAPIVTAPERPPCGGTVEATGTTPAGTFTASTIWAQYYPCGIDVSFSIRDAGGLSLQLRSRVRLADGGADLAMETDTANATLTAPAPSPSTWMTSGTVTIASGNNPGRYDYDAGTRPGITGTFALTDDGFSLSGSFSTPYCWLDVCGTE